MVEVDISVILAGLSIAASIVYYASVLRNQNQTRQAQLFMQLYQLHISKERFKDSWILNEMEWEDYDDYTRKYDSSVNLENFAKRYNNWHFWDGMGLLLKKNLVDKEMIYYLLGGGFGVLMNWDKFGSIIKEMRVQLDRPDLYIWFEYLADEMMKMAEEKGKPWKPIPNEGVLIREET